VIKSVKCAIEVLCDGGSSYGFGHIRRSFTLARALTERRYPVKFTVISESGQKYITDFVSTTLTPSIQILDLPYEIEPWVIQANQKKIPTIALDYFGDARPTLTISIYEHRIPPHKGSRFTGLEYALIRSELLQHATSVIGEGIVVMIGGSDLNRVGESVAALLAHECKYVSLIQGPGIKDDYSIDLPNVTVLCCPSTLEKKMATCEWAVTNGGGSMMEMMCLGKAVHVVPQTNDELILAEIIYNKGALLGIGLDTLKIPSLNEITSVGERARELVDGKGVNRIIDLIEGLPSE
jgi:spore coat polysaccharide biosynthesis predicted glycosyltransferase SpsG